MLRDQEPQGFADQYLQVDDPADADCLSDELVIQIDFVSHPPSSTSAHRGGHQKRMGATDIPTPELM